MATAAIAHETIEFTVAALQTKWGLSTYPETPATPHGLILVDLQASAGTSEDVGPQEMTQKEIEAETGVTQGAVSKQLARVREYIAAKKAAK